MHLLDLTHWIAGPLPLHSALLRTHFWDTPVEDNAALLLGRGGRSARAPWAHAARELDRVEEHVLARDLLPDAPSCSVDGLVRSYGPQTPAHLPHAPRARARRISRSATYPDEDQSWTAEWEHFAEAIASGRPMLGSLAGRPLRMVTGSGGIQRFAGVRPTGDRTARLAR